MPVDSVERPVPTDPEPVYRLREAVRRVKLAEASRVDAATELRHAEIARLELLRDELADVIAEIPDDDDRFELAILPGDPPRLWVDVTGHVVMARDRQTYRFVNDTRLGRVVLCESADAKRVADTITTYIAERIVEREKVFATDYFRERVNRDATGAGPAEEKPAGASSGDQPSEAGSTWKATFAIIGVMIIGALLVAAYMDLF
ncbi:MAG: hypothetical protein KDJ16_05165 [Hyphomicrobiales bacterium]|nr:hypothetical protein [Hyphomicrobiales bacterium]